MLICFYSLCNRRGLMKNSIELSISIKHLITFNCCSSSDTGLIQKLTQIEKSLGSPSVRKDLVMIYGILLCSHHSNYLRRYTNLVCQNCILSIFLTSIDRKLFQSNLSQWPVIVQSTRCWRILGQEWYCDYNRPHWYLYSLVPLQLVHCQSFFHF